MKREQIMAEFERHGILPTEQRTEIAEVLLEKAQHLSAEHIIEALREKGSGVSKATVYNTLHLFSEHGLVRECIVDPERRFYDSNIEPHHHFYNVDTGQLIDIEYDRVTFEDLPEFPGQGEIDSVEVLIKVRGKKR
jgi:Fur family iron response transcriptional regulator